MPIKTMNDIEQYIQQFPSDVRHILTNIRGIIWREVPGVEERISYGMPGYYLNGKPLVYYAAFKNHIGLYATPNGHEAFAAELSGYKQGKGSVQFPLSGDIPFTLITSMVRFRRDQLSNT